MLCLNYTCQSCWNLNDLIFKHLSSMTVNLDMLGNGKNDNETGRESGNLSFSVLSWVSKILFNVVLHFSHVYKKGNAPRTDPFSEPSVKAKVVGRGLPANLPFFPILFFLLMSLPASVFFWSKFLLPSVGFYFCERHNWHLALCSTLCIVCVALTTVKISTMFLKT